jgi:hypothetical protein
LRATPRLRMVSRASGPRLEGAPESRPLEMIGKDKCLGGVAATVDSFIGQIPPPAYSILAHLLT